MAKVCTYILFCALNYDSVIIFEVSFSLLHLRASYHGLVRLLKRNADNFCMDKFVCLMANMTCDLISVRLVKGHTVPLADSVDG